MSGTMSQRQLGKNGPYVSSIGFGAMNLSPFEGAAPPDEERFAVLDRAIELGSTYIDSADIYGDNEELIGRYFKKYPNQRQKVFLATKFAIICSPEGVFSIKGDANYVHQSIEKSLNRLQLDYVDLYYIHRIDKNVPIEETMIVMKELVEKGKIKYIGLSECSSDTIRRAYAIHPIACVQIEYSPFTLDIEKEEVGVLKTCQELGIAIVCYGPLSYGMLTGQIKSHDDLEENDFRRHQPRFSKENFPKNFQLVEAAKKFAETKGCTVCQLILAWILAQGKDFIVIPGTTKIKNLEENVGADRVKLTKEETEQIRKAFQNIDIAGKRYTEEGNEDYLLGDSAPPKN